MTRSPSNHEKRHHFGAKQAPSFWNAERVHTSRERGKERPLDGIVERHELVRRKKNLLWVFLCCVEQPGGAGWCRGLRGLFFRGAEKTMVHLDRFPDLDTVFYPSIYLRSRFYQFSDIVTVFIHPLDPKTLSPRADFDNFFKNDKCKMRIVGIVQ